MAGDLYEATEGLSVIIRHLDDFEHGGLILDGQGVAELGLQLKAIRALIKRADREVSWYRLKNLACGNLQIKGSPDALPAAPQIAAGNVVPFRKRSQREPGEWR